MSNDGYQIVFCTCPDANTAKQLAQQLLAKKLAACVNIINAVDSLYFWAGTIHTSTECLLIIKSQTSHYRDLEHALQAAHPYDVPEIIAMPITQGLPTYLEWIKTTMNRGA